MHRGSKYEQGMRFMRERDASLAELKKHMKAEQVTMRKNADYQRQENMHAVNLLFWRRFIRLCWMGFQDWTVLFIFCWIMFTTFTSNYIGSVYLVEVGSMISTQTQDY
jgi:hypothetical protein